MIGSLELVFDQHDRPVRRVCGEYVRRVTAIANFPTGQLERNTKSIGETIEVIGKPWGEVMRFMTPS